jgi:hypothetical protein
MLLFDLALEQKLFSDRQAQAFRLYLAIPSAREWAHSTLLAHHRQSLEALALPKPDRMGHRVARSLLDDRGNRFRRALDALADLQGVKQSFFPSHLMDPACQIA